MNIEPTNNMNTTNTTNTATTTTREVTPQWADGNLGTHKIKTVEITPEKMKDLLAAHPAYVCRLFNGQMSIQIGKTFNERVTERLAEAGLTKGDEEKNEDWKQRSYQAAKAVAKDVAAEVFDFFAIALDNASSTRRKAKRVLTNFDAVVAMVAAKWTITTEEKRAKLAASLELAYSADMTTEDMLDAIKAAFKPAVVATVEDVL